MYGGPHSNVLMEVGIPVWDHDKCVKSFVDSVFDETICAGGFDGGKDACQVLKQMKCCPKFCVQSFFY